MTRGYPPFLYFPQTDPAIFCDKLRTHVCVSEETPTLDFFSCQVVITVFMETDASSPIPEMAVEDGDGYGDAEQPTLIFNLYCSKMSKSADVHLPHAMQKMMTGDISWWHV